MDTAGSVSKGCFAFKGTRKRAKVEDYLRGSKSDSGARKRHEGFIASWEDIDMQIQILQSDLNTKIFEELLLFASNSHSGFSLDSKQNTVQEIPTAALVTGVNTPDHSVMFGNLVDLLKDRVSPLVAILKSKDCPTVKGILGKTLGQLLDAPQLGDDEEEEELENIQHKKLPLTLATLVTWYRQKYSSGKSSPKKRKSLEGQPIPMQSYPPVVIVFEDLESFSPRVLQDFITITTQYSSQVPVVFVFGIATSVSAVHRLLPNEVSSLLCMEKFQAPPSTEYLTLVINQILMVPEFPFKLGARVFQLLLDIFLYHDFSVLNFISGLRFAMLDHYFNMPLSFLCCPGDRVADKVKQMKKESVEELRQLPSFMRYVEGRPVKEQPELLLNESFTKERISSLITALHTYHASFFPVLRCLHGLVMKLPRHPLGKQLREIYSLALESNIYEKEEYKHSLELLRMMSKEELKELVRKSLESLSGDIPTELQDITPEIQDILKRFDTLHDMVEEEMETETPSTESPVPGKTTMHELRQHLLTKKKESEKKKLSPYENLRLQTIDYFHTIFQKFLTCPKALPLHEVLYYDSASTIRRHLNASPRSALQTALSNPQHYLQCHCCTAEAGQVLCTMPDICIVYKLHLECGQLINLYDWMQAFITVVGSENEENHEDPAKPDKLLHARFIRAVSELQFLGFVKPTKRKTDHVARLTWGGC